MEPALHSRARAARDAIALGTLRGPRLMDAILAVPARDRDAWVDEVLGIDPPPPDDPDLPRGSVPYLPCAVGDILTMAREVPLREADHFVDLGSGLGRVVLLAHLLSGARASGVEIQEHLVVGARRCASVLSLAGVSFHHADAREIDLDGSVFFLYAPFNGRMLTQVVHRLEQLARVRRRVVCTVDLELHEPTWLVPRPTSCSRVIFYDARAR